MFVEPAPTRIVAELWPGDHFGAPALLEGLRGSYPYPYP